MSMTLELTGSGLGQRTVLTFDQLAKIPTVRLDDVLMQKTHEDDEVNSWQGPALEPLLTAAQIKPGAMMVTLEAEDGYKIEARLEELKDAILAIKDGEGRWLKEAESDCALKLVPPHLPGNFWVVNISRIRVEPADESAP
jgi:DMSO/TMAO reductase YedYZ molybdopterin-dependent catalytic subunit